ncbi:Tripartite tricarboxylate transporter family receptor [compost metagenome]
MVSWTGLFAPKGTPPEVVDKLQAWTLEFVNSPEAAAHHTQRGTNPYPASGAQLAKAIVEDQANWQRMIKLAGIQPE